MKKKKQTETKRFESREIKQSTFVNEDYKMIRAFIIMLVIVVGLLGLLYLFNGKVVTKDMVDNETNETTEPTYDDKIILADNIFKVSEKEYMVLLYETEDDLTNILYNGLFNGYSGSSSLYSVDLSNGMNKKHFDKNQRSENKKPSKASEVVVSGPTLLIIKDGQVTEYITDSVTIKEKLKAE